MSLTVRAPAKINLHLGVGAPREDGFHPLTTVYHAIGICDDLTAAASPGWTLGVRVPAWMDADGIPVDGDNIVDRAARLLATHHGLPLRGEVRIAKAIPVAGGMAGGSADAAAALVALDRLWEAGTPDEELLALAAELGSDVPFSLVGGTALGEGRGEVVSTLVDTSTWWWVVVPSSVGLSTPAVYRRFDELSPDAPAVPPGAERVLDAVAAGDPIALAVALHNDLEPAALDLRPELGRLLEQGESLGALRGIVSGSGPTCVFLADSADAAREVAAGLEHSRPTGSSAVLVANGPVAGAHVVEYA